MGGAHIVIKSTRQNMSSGAGHVGGGRLNLSTYRLHPSTTFWVGFWGDEIGWIKVNLNVHATDIMRPMMYERKKNTLTYDT